MNKWTDFPMPLKKKILIGGLIGATCLFVGITFCIFSKDMIMLLLSIGVFLFSAYRVITLYRVASKGEYEIVEGMCTRIAPKLFGKYCKVTIVDKEKNERTLLVDKGTRIKVGNKCRFYFTKTEKLTIGKEYFDLPDFSDNLLGYELEK